MGIRVSNIVSAYRVFHSFVKTIWEKFNMLKQRKNVPMRPIMLPFPPVFILVYVDYIYVIFTF